MDEVLFATGGSTEWETPQDFFNIINQVYKFDIDVCATRENTKCKKYFTPELDGLAQDWIGTIWCNPPYGREVEKWVQKAHESHKQGAVIVMLLPSRTDTKWIHKYVFGSAQVIFLKGRLKFENSYSSAPFPSILAIWGGEEKQCNILARVLEAYTTRPIRVGRPYSRRVPHKMKQAS
jgi:phage N-6-adenine-methyltransferase